MSCGGFVHWFIANTKHNNCNLSTATKVSSHPYSDPSRKECLRFRAGHPGPVQNSHRGHRENIIKVVSLMGWDSDWCAEKDLHTETNAKVGSPNDYK